MRGFLSYYFEAWLRASLREIGGRIIACQQQGNQLRAQCSPLTAKNVCEAIDVRIYFPCPPLFFIHEPFVPSRSQFWLAMRTEELAFLLPKILYLRYELNPIRNGGMRRRWGVFTSSAWLCISSPHSVSSHTSMEPYHLSSTSQDFGLLVFFLNQA